MDAEVLKFLGMLIVGIIGTLLKMQIDRVHTELENHKESHKQLAQEMTEVKINYVHKADFQEFKTELWTRFDRLEDKLNK